MDSFSDQFSTWPLKQFWDIEFFTWQNLEHGLYFRLSTVQKESALLGVYSL